MTSFTHPKPVGLTSPLWRWGAWFVAWALVLAMLAQVASPLHSRRALGSMGGVPKNAQERLAWFKQMALHTGVRFSPHLYYLVQGEINAGRVKGQMVPHTTPSTPYFILPLPDAPWGLTQTVAWIIGLFGMLVIFQRRFPAPRFSTFNWPIRGPPAL